MAKMQRTQNNDYDEFRFFFFYSVFKLLYYNIFFFFTYFIKFRNYNMYDLSVHMYISLNAGVQTITQMDIPERSTI